MLEIRGNQQLQIGDVRIGKENLTVQLANASKFSRVHVFATRYLPDYSVYNELANVRDTEPVAIKWPSQRSFYAAGRDIGEEYRYIIDRKYASKFPGNMLDRPSLILNPWDIRDTSTELKVAARGTEYSASDAEAAPATKQLRRQAQDRDSRVGATRNLDFLGEPSAVLVNLKPDQDGTVTVKLAELGPHQHFHLVAVDPLTTAYRSVSLPESPMPFDDVRLIVGLDPTKHFMRKKQATLLGAGDTFVVDDIVSSKFEYYDSIEAIYRLYTTLTKDEQLAKFEFITRWPELDDAEKRAKYSEFACHELHFFLYHKDREFFNEVVREYLGNKLHPTFMDLWLLENENITDYRTPWRHAQLNVAERILLGDRIKAERPFMQRHIDDLFAVQPSDINTRNEWFQTAIAGQSLDSSDGVAGARLRAIRNVENVQSNLRKMEAETAVPSMGRAGGQYSKRARGSALQGADSPARSGEASGPQGLEPRNERLSDAINSIRDLAEEAAEDDDRGIAMDAYFGDEFAPDGEIARERADYMQLYRKLAATREWVENNYYRLPIEQQNTNLVNINALWHDYANRKIAGNADEAGFLSEHFPAATGSFAEMMLALSVLDVPFKAGDHQETFDEAKLTIAAASPMIMFDEQVREVEVIDGAATVLTSQNFFRHGDRHQMVDGQQQDKFITDEFLVHTVYGCQVVVTNTSSTSQQVDVLLQVPVGAIPVLGSKYTKSVPLQLPAYSTQTQEYYFYFPAAGDMKHFPVHVAHDDQLIAHGEPFTFHVVDTPSNVDKTSWTYVSQFGSDTDVLEFLGKHNLQEINLELIAFRMQDKEFFRRAVQLLGAAHAYSDTLWAYSVKHDLPPQIREFLAHHEKFVRGLGQQIDSDLVEVKPIARKWYQHMDYRPLVNARAHQLGRNRTILNDRFRSQYQQLMWLLSYRDQLNDDERMAVTYYLLVQDRIEEAIEFFSSVDRNAVAMQLQYDYFAAYLDCFQPTPDLARSIAAKYADHPVDRWRNTFASLNSMLDELDGKSPGVIDEDDRNQRQTELAARQPTFEFEVAAKTVNLDYQNLATVTVNYYLMDLELLFSRNPFVQEFSGQFSSIRPNQAVEIELPAGKKHVEFPLPSDLHNRNVLVEVRGGGKTDSHAYYSNALSVQLIENYGQLRVTQQTTGKPLATVYVKVYAEMLDGQIKFYKDGYTDLRGRFDYTSLNTDQLPNVRRFSLLILSEEHGAIVREATPPKR